VRRKILIGLLIAVLVGVLVTVLVLAQHAQPSTDIMAGSSLISNIIQDVAGDKMETRTLIPPGLCPGHYDVKPSDIEALANSNISRISMERLKLPKTPTLLSRSLMLQATGWYRRSRLKQ
jgi:ABC-type Zn uptake system ZnuABC Zn-binding protein ZnuA